jgi:hypothetical protein
VWEEARDQVQFAFDYDVFTEGNVHQMDGRDYGGE